MKKRIVSILLASVLVMGSLCSLCGIGLAQDDSASSESHGKAYILLVDKLSINDINEYNMPALCSLADEGAVGLASNRTLAEHNSRDSIVTISAGNLARCYEYGLNAYNTEELIKSHNMTAGELYEAYTTWPAAPGNVVVVNISEIRMKSAAENIKTVPGAMGEALKNAGYKIAVLGNSDLPTVQRRPAAGLAMDARGMIYKGDVGPACLRTNEASFLGMESNYPYLHEKFLEYSQDNDVIVVDLGDLSRWESMNLGINETALKEKGRLLKNIDDYIGFVASQCDLQKDLLIVVSPSPSSLQAGSSYFTPVIAIGPSITSGVLTSATTRRDFVVANTDIAPTVLDFFRVKIPEESMIGRPITSNAVDEKDAIGAAQAFSSRTEMVNALRSSLIEFYVLILITTIVLAMVVFYFYRRLLELSKILLLSIGAFPLAVLAAGFFDNLNSLGYVMVLLFFIALITFAALVFSSRKYFRAFLLLSMITVAALNIDIITGANTIQRSILGYNLAAGARYYGVGNEYLGVLMGASILLCAAFYQKWNKVQHLPLLAIFLMLQCALAGLPSMGAQSDGFFTMPLAFALLLALLAGVRIKPFHFAVLALAGVTIISGIAIYDMNRPEQLQSHIGRTASQVLNGGFPVFWSIVTRRLNMNIALIVDTIWSKVFLIMAISVALLAFRPVGLLKSLQDRMPYLFKGFIAIAAGAVLVLITNDTGIVAATTTIIYLVIPAILMALAAVSPGKGDGEQIAATKSQSRL